MAQEKVLEAQNRPLQNSLTVAHVIWFAQLFHVSAHDSSFPTCHAGVQDGHCKQDFSAPGLRCLKNSSVPKTSMPGRTENQSNHSALCKKLIYLVAIFATPLLFL